MKAQSLEHQLRHTTPPMPDPEARQRARRAALAEFERIHAPAHHATADDAPADHAQAPAPTPRTSRARFFGPLNWASRNVWMGGVATACVVVIGVSVVWLMPARDRAPHLNISMSPTGQKSPPKPATNEEAVSDITVT